MQLYRVTLQLARNPGMPQGDAGQGYMIVVPLGPGGQIDVEAWRAHQADCHVKRFDPDPAEEAEGWLKHRGQNWYFHYGDDEAIDDDTAFRFAAHALKEGEYITINQAGRDAQTYKVTDVSPLRA